MRWLTERRILRDAWAEPWPPARSPVLEFRRMLVSTMSAVSGETAPAAISLLPPAKFGKLLTQGPSVICQFRIVLSPSDQPADPPHPLPLLRPQQTHNLSLSASYSITSSAIASMLGGTSRPIVLAVVKLMTSSYFVGCMTGNSAGFSPLRTRPT
jgi:hypothetical protein